MKSVKLEMRFSLVLFLAVLIWMSGCSRSDDWHLGLIEYVPQGVNLTRLHPELRQRIESATDAALRGENVVESVIELSRLYHANGFLAEAMSCYEGLVIFQDDEPKWKHLFAFMLASYGYSDDAEMLWREVVEKAPDYLPARARLADVLLKTNRLDESEIVYHQVLERSPENQYGLIGLGRIAMARGRWEDAVDWFERTSRASDGKLGRDLLVTAYERTGQEHRAFAIRGETVAAGTHVDIPDVWLSDVFNECYDPVELMNQGGFAAFGGNPWEGIRWFTRMLELDPDNPLGHYQIALVYQQVGQNTMAIQHLRRCVELRPNFSDAWLRLVWILRQMGQSSEADVAFYEGFAHCQESQAYNIEYGRILAGQGNHLRALDHMRKAVRLNPNEARPHLELASVLFALNRVDEGVKSLRVALDVEAGNPVAMTTLCFYAIRNGDQEEADRWLAGIRQHPRVDASTKLQLRLEYAEKFN